MFEKLKEMFLKGILNERMLGNAVKKGWISEEQKLQIIQSKIDLNKNLTNKKL